MIYTYALHSMTSFLMIGRPTVLPGTIRHRDRAARRYAGQAGAGLRRARGRGAGGLAYSGVKYLYDNIIV